MGNGKKSNVNSTDVNSQKGQTTGQNYGSDNQVGKKNQTGMKNQSDMNVDRDSQDADRGDVDQGTSQNRSQRSTDRATDI